MEHVDNITFAGAGGARLSARLHTPAGPVRAHALFAHCFTCSKDVRAARRIASSLSDLGIATLRFDFTGLGDSEGEFADTTFSSNLDDVVAAADYLAAHHAPPSILVGHSLGGAAVLAAAHRIDSCVAVATIGAPADPEHVRKLIDASAPELTDAGEAMVTIGGRPFRMKRAFLDDLAEQCSAERIGALKRALLVMHAPLDNVVSIDNASAIFGAAHHPKSFVSLDRADHLLSRPADGDYVAAVLAAWTSRYLPELEVRPSEGQVVARIGDKGFATALQVGAHALVADEPADVGGTELGPNPYDYLLCGLGACTAMTLRMYADRKQLPLEAVEVRLDHQKIHARDCEDCEGDSGRIDVIERVVTLTGPLDDAQRTRLLAIADRCPVHRTLESEVKVRTRLGEADAE